MNPSCLCWLNSTLLLYLAVTGRAVLTICSISDEFLFANVDASVRAQTVILRQHVTTRHVSLWSNMTRLSSSCFPNLPANWTWHIAVSRLRRHGRDRSGEELQQQLTPDDREIRISSPFVPDENLTKHNGRSGLGIKTLRRLRYHAVLDLDEPTPNRDRLPAPLLDSSCFQPSDWERIAKDIGRAYHSYDGFVVCMGTDTMAYASSALSFMLENLGKTVRASSKANGWAPST